MAGFELEKFGLLRSTPHVAFRTCLAVLWATLSVPFSGANAGTIWCQPSSETAGKGGKDD